MKRLLLIIILVEAIVLGFYLGATFQIKKQVAKQDSCIEYVHKQEVNLDKFFNEKITDIPSIFLHSEAAIDILYTRCTFGE